MKHVFRWLYAAGVALVIVSLVLLAGGRIYEARIQHDSAAAAARMEELLAVRSAGIQSGSSAMPTLELSGRDYAALLEAPGFGITLPVSDDWEDRLRVGNPCRYWGSCNDGSLIIGGSPMAQLDFCARLDLGDRILITDMQGREFTYFVTRILRAEKVTFDRLREGEEPLTIFTRDGYSSRYIIVKCGSSA